MVLALRSGSEQDGEAAVYEGGSIGFNYELRMCELGRGKYRIVFD
jgi:hypothetical protein